MGITLPAVTAAKSFIFARAATEGIGTAPIFVDIMDMKPGGEQLDVSMPKALKPRPITATAIKHIEFMVVKNQP